MTRKYPRALRSCGTQAAEVISPEPISSSSACRIALVISECIQFGELNFVLREFSSNRVYNLSGRLAEKDFIRKLAPAIGDILLQLLALLRDAFLLRFHLPGWHV